MKAANHNRLMVVLSAALCAGTVAMAGSSQSCNADVLAYTFNLTGFGATANGANGGANGAHVVYTLGDVFTTTSTLTIDGLAAYNLLGTSVSATSPTAAGQATPISVALYNNSTQALITSGTVTAATPTYNLDGSSYTVSNGESGSGWSVVTLSTPVSLVAGTYMIAAQMNGTDFAQSVGTNQAAGVGAITARDFGTPALNGPISFPTNNVGGTPPNWFGGDLVLATPEPASLGLMSLGGLGLLLVGRRRKTA